LRRGIRAHGSFQDLQTGAPQIAQALGLPPGTFEPLIGTIDPDRSIAAQRAYIAAFFDLHPAPPQRPPARGALAPIPEIEFMP
jgi:hypothetical protein